MNPAQNAPLTRSPRGNDGDGGDGADSSAWVEDKKQDGAVSSEAGRVSITESLQTTLDQVVCTPVGDEGMPKFRRMKKFSPPTTFPIDVDIHDG
jgi:hypothetical protein